jgi:DNA-binding NarL/FixJ family response regulator
MAAHLFELLRADFDVVTTVSDGFALLGAAATLQPDVIVADVGMPGLDGIEAAGRILRDRPGCRIVLVSVHDEAALVQQALDVGVMAFVRKVTAGDDLVPAVHAALRGERRSPDSGRNGSRTFPPRDDEPVDTNH